MHHLILCVVHSLPEVAHKEVLHVCVLRTIVSLCGLFLVSTINCLLQNVFQFGHLSRFSVFDYHLHDNIFEAQAQLRCAHSFIATERRLAIRHLNLTLVLNKVKGALYDRCFYKLVRDVEKLFEQLAVMLHNLCETVTLNSENLNV